MDSSSIFLSKIMHRGERRIAMQFEHDTELIQKTKSIKGRKWSQTKKCWHLSYRKSSFENLEKVFGKESLIFPKKEKEKELTPTTVSKKTKVSIEYTSYTLENQIRRKIMGNKVIIQQMNAEWLFVFVPYHKKGWMEAVKNIHGRKWKVEKVCWEIPNVKQSYRQMKKQIGMDNLIFDFVINKDIPEEYYLSIYWLMEGQSGGQYSTRSVQNVFRQALEKSKVFAYGTVHTLRHSYATHCIENGFDIALLQEALGHSSIKTTEKYLHISTRALKKLRSPLDVFKDNDRSNRA